MASSSSSSAEVECEILIKKLIESSSSSSPSSSSSSSSRIQDFLLATLPSIKCRPCSSVTAGEAGARAFIQIASNRSNSNSNSNSNSSRLEIVLCSNRLRKSEIEEALLHELVHYYDYTNNRYTINIIITIIIIIITITIIRVDFSSCEGLAYSEVRAAREAECKGYNIYPFEDWVKKKCVSFYASKSTCNMFPNIGSSCVHKVIDEAMKDLSPNNNTTTSNNNTNTSNTNTTNEKKNI